MIFITNQALCVWNAYCTCDHCQWDSQTCPIMLSFAWGCQLYFAWPLGGTAVHDSWGTTGLWKHKSLVQHPSGSVWIQYYFLNKRFVQSDTGSYCQSQPPWGTMNKSVLLSGRDSVCMHVFVGRLFSYMSYQKQSLFFRPCPDSYNTFSSMETFGLTVRKTGAELNVCHSTFGICFQEDLNIGCGDVSFLLLIPSDSCPAVSFVFFNDIQQLALRYGDSAFIMTCKRKGREKKWERQDIASLKNEYSEWEMSRPN